MARCAGCLFSRSTSCLSRSTPCSTCAAARTSTIGTRLAVALLALALCGAVPAAQIPARPPTGAADELDRAFIEAARSNGAPAPADRLSRRLLAEYGALWIARGVRLPPGYRFRDAAELERWQASVRPTAVQLGSTRVELQPAAARALEAALAEARAARLPLHARGGPSAARRSYGDAARFWKTRVDAACAHWVKKRQLSAHAATALRALPLDRQIETVLEEEDRGRFFALSLDRTVMRSTAPPGSSQHHAMLALDVEEHARAEVRALLARHGWFQTVASDLPHFTYLGLPENELAGEGLARVQDAGRAFWIPARRTPP